MRGFKARLAWKSRSAEVMTRSLAAMSFASASAMAFDGASENAENSSTQW